MVVQHSSKALASHRWRSHGWIDPRRLEVTGRTCPACGVTFSSRGYARTHYANRTCPQSRGETEQQGGGDTDDDTDNSNAPDADDTYDAQTAQLFVAATPTTTTPTQPLTGRPTQTQSFQQMVDYFFRPIIVFPAAD